MGACVKARVVCLDSPWAAGCVTRMESPEGGVEGWTPPRARSGGGRTLRAKGTNPGRLSMLSLRGLGPRRLCSAPRCLRNSGTSWSLPEGVEMGRPERCAAQAERRPSPPCSSERVPEADPERVRATVGALGMNLEGGGGRGGEFGMSSVSCGNGKLRQWLIDQIDSGKYPGLVWENEEKSIFRIPWKHAGKQDYNREEDAALFKVTIPRAAHGRDGGGPRRARSAPARRAVLRGKGPDRTGRRLPGASGGHRPKPREKDRGFNFSGDSTDGGTGFQS